jgi:hypothetical protein
MKDEERKLWTDHIYSYKTSGLTAVKWAEDNNVSVHKLRSCIAKFNKEKRQASNKESGLDEWVSLTPSKSIYLNESIEPLKVTIGLATIEVTSGFDQDTLKSLIEVLSQC